LLDVLREALEDRASKARAGANRAWARAAAVKIARAGQQFLNGVTISAGLPGVQVSYSPGGTGGDGGASPAVAVSDPARPGPSSYYHAGFVTLRNAIGELSA